VAECRKQNAESRKQNYAFLQKQKAEFCFLPFGTIPFGIVRNNYAKRQSVVLLILVFIHRLI